MRTLLLSFISMSLLTCATTDSTSSSSSSSNTNTAAPPPAANGEAPPPDEDKSPLVTPAEVAWKDMTKAQRGRYMHKVVMPKMRDVFATFDDDAFVKPNCATCHGKNPKEHEFKMPSPDLPQLPASEKEFMTTVMKDKPEMVKFMSGKVTPTVAELLGLKPFDPKHPDPAAFGCHACHTLKGTPGP
jgi:cytochrome c553